MKPGDHPDFFRFPAPEGRSRESSIVLDRRGRFWHDGAPVEHAGMARAFASWIRQHPDTGRFILSNGFDWTYFRVEDVPFFVRAVRDSEQAPVLVLSDASEEQLDPSTLNADAEGALYCRVKQGSFEAKFSPEAQTRLAPWLVQAEDERVALEMSGQRFLVSERH